MWVSRIIRASRVESRRIFTLFAASALVAIFASSTLAQPVAAADAIWTGDTLTYEGNTYQPVTTPPDIDGKPNEYERRTKTTGGTTRATVLYFGKTPGASRQATLVTYDVVNGDYKKRGSERTIAVTRDLTVDDGDSAESMANTTCNVGTGIGWIICPVSNYLADGIDWVYSIIEQFLEVQTINRSDNGIYDIWRLIRSIANVCFIIVFMIIVYSQLTSLGYSNYNLKSMIPRLIIGAILVNTSFSLCALAVDASNLLGYSIQSILETVRENVITNVDLFGGSISWSTLTALAMGGGAVAGAAGFAAAAGGSAMSFSFLITAALIPAAFAVLVAFVILAARQALIVVLTIVSPLAFVAYVLPGTREYFEKWRKAFTTLLVFFPLFAMLFGGSQLAGTAIINTSETVQPAMKLPVVLIGLATMVVPLILTPLLVRFSSGLLGQIANIANSRNRGLVDRAQNWTRDNADMHKSRKLANLAERRAERQEDLKERIANGEKPSMAARYKARRPLALRMDQKKRERDQQRKHSDEMLSSLHDLEWARRLKEAEQDNDEFDTDEAGASTPRRRRTLDQRNLDQQRAAYRTKKAAEQYETIVQKAAEKSWSETARSETAVQDLVLRSTLAQEDAKLSEQKLTKLVENVKATGENAPGLNLSSESAIPTELKDIQLSTDIQQSAIENARRAQQKNIANVLKADDAISKTLQVEAAGVGGDSAVASVIARAKSTVSSAMVEDIKNIKSTMPYPRSSDPDRLMREFTQPNISMEERVAMVWASSENGNYGYEKAVKMIDWYQQHGGSGGGHAAKGDMEDFKELLSINDGLRNGGRDVELYLNDGKDTTRRISDFTNDVGTWNINTQRFAVMGETRQVEAIKALRATEEGRVKLQSFISDLSRTPTLLSQVKDGPKRMLGFASDDSSGTSGGTGGGSGGGTSGGE